MAACLVRQLTKTSLNSGLIVRDQTGFTLPWGDQGGGKPVNQAGQSLVFIDALSGTVADRNNADK